MREALEAARVFITPLERRKYEGDAYKEDAEKRIRAALSAPDDRKELLEALALTLKWQGLCYLADNDRTCKAATGDFDTARAILAKHQA